MNPSLRWIGLSLVSLLVVAGCNTGSSGGGSGGGSGSSPLDPNRNRVPNDNAFMLPGPMAEPRFLHTATLLPTGEVLVAGGADDSLGALASAEVYSPTLPQSNVPVNDPMRLRRGGFIDTDFRGDPIQMTEGRVFHTANVRSSGSIIVIGGAQDLRQGRLLASAEEFDSGQRIFRRFQGTMEDGRCRHTTARLTGDRFLVVGGQIQDLAGSFPDDTYASTKTTVEFDPNESQTQQFRTPTIGGTSQDLELVSFAGRADHATVRVAGPDNLMGNGDDLLIFLGGFDTLPGSNAPTQVFPPPDRPVRTVEYYNFANQRIVSGGFDVAARIRPAAVNLGERIGTSPVGQRGVANLILLGNGAVQTGQNTDIPPVPEVIQVNPSPFGFVNFTSRSDWSAEFHPTLEDDLPNQEIAILHNLGSRALAVRNATPYVMLERQIVFGGALVTVPWAFTVGGSQDYTYSLGALFDPFFTLTNSTAFLNDPGPYVLPSGRLSTGTWFVLDSLLPLFGYETEEAYRAVNGSPDGSTDPSDTVAVQPFRERFYHNLTRIPGASSADSIKAWVLFTGGISGGGTVRTVNPSAEVYVPPNANE